MPELYLRLAPTFFRRLAQRVHNSGTRLIVGVPRLQNGRLYDSALGPLFRTLGLPEPACDAGAGNTRMPVAGHKAGLAICYEIAFSRQIAATAKHAAFLINLSDDAWFGDSIGPDQNLQIARTCAMETGRAVLRDTDDGISAAIDAHGAITARIPQFQTSTLSVRAVPRTGLTPYARWTDRPLLALLALVFVGLLWSRRRRCSAARSSLSIGKRFEAASEPRQKTSPNASETETSVDKADYNEAA
ncbi:MAG: hypothetical protein PF501_01800 [Salinisphaera sp.]|nr:hypothetical protein [Salinisphaera sp.]